MNRKMRLVSMAAVGSALASFNAANAAAPVLSPTYGDSEAYAAPTLATGAPTVNYLTFPSALVEGNESYYGPNGNYAVSKVQSSITSASVLAKGDSISSSDSLGDPANATSGTEIDYYFEIVGPENSTVPIDLHAALSTYATTDIPSNPYSSNFAANEAVGFAELYIVPYDGTGIVVANTLFDDIAQSTAGATDCPGCDSYLDVDQEVLVPTNESIVVDIYAGGISDVGWLEPPEDFGEGGGTTTAGGSINLSPLTIDPSFLANNPGYSLYFSDGISDGVPEPASWATLLVGFAGLGAAMRSRRKLATASA